jgi:hypothetical protein
MGYRHWSHARLCLKPVAENHDSMTFADFSLARLFVKVEKNSLFG